MNLKKIQDQLNSSLAIDRKKALQKLGQQDIKSGYKEKIIKLVLEKLDDSSITVKRQAIKTLTLLSLQKVPDKLKILFKTSKDKKLQNLILSAIRRIELEEQKRQTGEIEWNLTDYVFSVSDFVDYINALLKLEIVQIKGEVSEVKNFRDQLVFFTLQDKESVISCWFPTTYQYKWNIELAEGLEVVVKVQPQVSKRSGRFGLKVLEMSLSGEGALALALKRTRTKLKAEGLFQKERKRALPWMPKRIGLITAENSAAYSDFIKVLKARMGGIKIFFAPVKVQGVGSIQEILGAINYFNQKVLELDLIVLTRGGGGLEDLQSFNSEEVVRAVFSSKIPIVVAVGHEKDWSLAELAADLRASTPSNAAELIVPERVELLRQLNFAITFLNRAVEQSIKEKKQAVFNWVNFINNQISVKLQYHHNLIDHLKIYLENFYQDYHQKRQLLKIKINQLFNIFENNYANKRQSFNALYQLLLSYSPKHILKRGYSVVKFGNKIIKQAGNLKTGDKITIWPFKGRIKSRVETIKS